ncbi:MAG: Asp-tRNA(Asn)/Glu-tRNA(Gln) amidotransferase subunit GatB [PVC group bacterium]
MNYEAVIGLEIHVQLNCATKMFCDCRNAPGDPPNSNICPICLGIPGTLKQFGRESLEKAVLSCLALNCEVQPESAFDQKVYYYPDLPRGFQLSQFHQPLGRNGWLDIPAEDGGWKRLRIRETHMEEDVARLLHETEGRRRFSLVDFNRAGAPLVEIVTEPDLRSPHDAMEFLRMLRGCLRYAGTAECSMDEGTMRADANISIRPEGSTGLATKVEVKNMNSIRHVGNAIAHEIARQTELVGRGKQVTLHTRLWDPERNVTTPMRGKFAGPCIPDPSVPVIMVSPEFLEGLRSRLPGMPGARRKAFEERHGLTPEESALMSSERELADYYEAVVAAGAPPRAAVDWITGRLLPILRERGESLASTRVTPVRLAALLLLVERREISSSAGKEVLACLFESDLEPAAIVAEEGLAQVSDRETLEAVADAVIADNPDAVQDYHIGKKPALGFLVGRAMKASGGTADPKQLRRLLEEKLGPSG